MPAGLPAALLTNPAITSVAPQAGELEQQLAAELAERQRAQQRAADLQRDLDSARAAANQQYDSLGGKVATLEWQLQEACAQAAQVGAGAGSGCRA